MFRRMESESGRRLEFTFDGAPASGIEGDSVAAALLSSGHSVFRRSPVKGNERGPLCMMGVCFECLVTIDGSTNVQACLTPLKEGMTVTKPAIPAMADDCTMEKT